MVKGLSGGRWISSEMVADGNGGVLRVSSTVVCWGGCVSGFVVVRTTTVAVWLSVGNGATNHGGDGCGRRLVERVMVVLWRWRSGGREVIVVRKKRNSRGTVEKKGNFFFLFFSFERARAVVERGSMVVFTTENPIVSFFHLFYFPFRFSFITVESGKRV